MYVKNYFLIIIISLNIIKKKKKQLLKYMQAQNNNLELPLIFQPILQLQLLCVQFSLADNSQI